MPHFNLPSYSGREMSSGRSEGEGGDFASEGEVVKRNSARNVGEDGATVFVNR